MTILRFFTTAVARRTGPRARTEYRFRPTAHAYWFRSLQDREEKNETVVQVGAGSGYYTAILAHLVGPEGRVYAYEMTETLAARAAENLRDVPHVGGPRAVRCHTGLARGPM